MTIKLKGQKILDSYLKKMSNPEKVFDPEFKKVARQGVRNLGKETPKKTGNTARGWTNPLKISLSKYVVSNSIKTADKKHLLVNILDKGRGVVVPKRAKKLYIPLTEKGRAKKLGGRIPANLVYGIDYILADRARATKGEKFLDKEEKRAGKELTKLMIKKIRVL